MSKTVRYVGAFLSVPLAIFAAQTTREPIWSGVYTTAQAERGRTVVVQHCAECHQDDLRGGEGPALKGDSFMVKWESHTVERLFHKVRDTMPTPDDTDVSEAEKLDSVAYILQQNGFPSGKTELTVTGDLAAIRIAPPGGAAPPRPGALVQTVGCLQEQRGSAWILSAATDVKVTTLDPLTAAQKESLKAEAAGAQTIELLSVFPRPDALKQQKVIVKGLFIKTPTATRINVMALEPLGAACP